MRRCAVGILAAWLLTLSGCYGAAPEPESAFQPLPQPQAYDFLTVWECCLEACEREGFSVAKSKRDGDTGEWITDHRETFKDAVARRDRSIRLHGRVAPAGAGSFTVTLAASEFQRDEAGDWSYKGPDPELRGRFERRLHESLTRRYQGGPR